jgi:hypothetical protein
MIEFRRRAVSVIKIKALATSETSRTKRISKSNWIEASIAFGFYFYDHDPVTRLMLSNK